MQKAKKLFMLMAMLFCGMAAAWAAQTVTVIQPQNGQVTFSPATPAAGEMVTITVTPDQGYCIHKADIVVSKIINPGSAQSPARIGIAENIEISGIEPTDPTLEANYTFVMPADPINVQISATFSEAPSYTVSLDPAADTENGDATFRPTEAKKGETVNIELAPVLGYQVSNVTASYMAMSTQTQVDVTKVNDLLYTFVMPAANVNVLPTFELKQFEIKISDNIENGTVTANRPTAGMDEEVILTVTPAEGYQVKEVIYTWYPGGESDATGTITPDENGVYKFNMPFTYDRVLVKATFEKIPYNIIVAETQNGSIQVAEDKTTAGIGEEVTFFAFPDAGYQVSNVSVSYMAMSTQTEVPVTDNNGTYTFTMPAKDVTIAATFELKQFEVLIADGIENGTVASNRPTAGMGEEVILTVTPAEGYQVQEVRYTWYPGGDSDATSAITPDENGVYKFNMPLTFANVMVSAIFEKIPYNIIVAETQNGSIQVAEDKTTAGIGEEVTFFAFPDAGYQVSNVSVSYMAMSTQTEVPVTDNNGTYTFTMPAKDVTIAATFELKQFEVLIADGIENGTVASNRPTAGMGEEVILTVTPAEGYQVQEVHYTWYPGGDSDATSTITPDENGVYKFNMPFTYDRVIVSATFEELPVKKYNITVLETENGTAETDKAQAAIGETVTITVTPAQGYELDQLTVSASYEIQGGDENPRAPRRIRYNQGNITVTKVDDTHYTFVLPETLPNTLTPNYQDNTDFQVKATFKQAKVLTPLHTILTEGVDGNDYTVAEAMAVVKVLGGDAYVTDGTDYIRLQLNDAIAEQLIEGNKSLEGTVTGKLDLRDTNPVLVVSELSENAVENDGISTAIQSVDMSQSLVPQVKLAQVVRMSGYWDGNALRAYSATPQGQSLIITNNHMPANWQVGGNYTVTVAIYLNEAWEAEQPAGGAPRRVKAGDDLDFQNLRGELINLEITTAIDTLLMDSNVADVHYVNVAGQVSDRPFEGINIMVMKLNDGTTRTVKVVK